MKKKIMALAAAAAASLAAAQTHATVVSFDLSGIWGQVDGALPPVAFLGRITYDTATLSYRDGNQGSGYGDPDAVGGNVAGSYSITWDGHTYAAAVNYIQLTKQTLCDSKYTNQGDCTVVDFTLASALPHPTGRLYVYLPRTAPFDGVLLPDTAPSSDSAYYAFLSAYGPDRYARTTQTQGARLAFVGSGSTLSFGSPGAIPEPATWAMMFSGFGMIGFAARRRAERAVHVTYA